MIKIPSEYISENELRSTVSQLAVRVAKGIDDSWVVLVLLRGSFIFAADFVRELSRHSVHPSIDFMNIQSYHHGTESSGTTITAEPTNSIQGKSVLLLDDIFDTGYTLSAAAEFCQRQGASDVKSLVLFEKPARRVAEFSVDYVGRTIEDIFIVGYGLDHANQYRSLPYIGVINS